MTAKTIFIGIIIILALLVAGFFAYIRYIELQQAGDSIEAEKLKVVIAELQGDNKALNIQIDNANDKITDLETELANIEPQTVKIITQYKEATPIEKKVIVSKAVEQMKKEMRGIGF